MSNVLRRSLVALALIGAASLMGCAKKESTDLAADASGRGTPGSIQDFKGNVGDKIYFLADQTELSPEAKSILDRQAQWLNRYASYGVLIEGHADERGTREYNQALGGRRAATVRAYLESRGVNSGRVRTLSWGKERPATACDEERCWSQNRRVVTSLDGARAGLAAR